MKSWAVFGALSALILLAVGGAVLGLCIGGWKNSAYYTWEVTANATLTNVVQDVNRNLQFVEFAARSVAHIAANQQTTPLSRLLAEMYDAYDGESGYSFGSFGYMQFNGTAKTSWQIASGFGCPDYMYAYSDPVIWPTFVGYCVNRSGIYLDNVTDYVGTDWGLKPQEKLLFAGSINQTFLPITTLIGMPTLTFEIYDNSMQAVLFAEMNLTTFSNDVSSYQGSVAFIYVCETASQLMIASSVPNTVLFPNGTRQMLPPLDRSNFVIWSQRILSPDWTIYTGLTWNQVYGNLQYTTMIAGVVGMSIVLGGAALLFVLYYCFVTRVLYKPDAYSVFSDIPAGAAIED